MTSLSGAKPALGTCRLVSKPWGHEIVVTDAALPYTGKLIHVRAGHRLSLQIHNMKTETLVLISGSASLALEVDGKVTEIEMVVSEGYTVLPGRRHRLSAAEDSVVMEVSTPEVGTTYRLEDDYSRLDEVRR